MNVVSDYIFKPLLVFLIGYLILRLSGKKAVSQMTSIDLLFVVILGTQMSEPVNSRKIWETAYYGFAIFIVYLALSYLSLNNKLRWILVDSPTVLIRNGDIDERGLRKVRMTTKDLISQLRTKGYTNPKDIELAIMEDVGKVSIIPKSYARPLEPKDIQLTPKPAFIPIPVIMNGQILDHNLKYLQKDRKWLGEQLSALGHSSENVNDITLATINDQGFLELDTDMARNSDKGNPYLYKPGQEN